MAEVRTSHHELRRCDACGYEVLRASKPGRPAYHEVSCHGCRGVEFTIFDPLWVQRGAGFIINHEEPLCLPTS